MRRRTDTINDIVLLLSASVVYMFLLHQIFYTAAVILNAMGKLLLPTRSKANAADETLFAVCNLIYRLLRLLPELLSHFICVTEWTAIQNYYILLYKYHMVTQLGCNKVNDDSQPFPD